MVVIVEIFGVGIWFWIIDKIISIIYKVSLW